MPLPQQFKRLDVRPLLARGELPLPEIRRRVAALKRGEGLLLIAPFPPAPLIELLRGEGFATRLERGGQGEWKVHFWRDTEAGAG